MDEHGVTVTAVAADLKRTHGYVSQRTTGRSALSLDIVQSVAYLARINPKALTLDLQERVGRMSAPPAMEALPDNLEEPPE